MDERVFEPGCCEGWTSLKSKVNGECPDCGKPTVDGEAACGCFHSPQTCKTCGWRACDGSCKGEE